MLDSFWAFKKVHRNSRAFAAELISGVLEHLKELDKRIALYTEHWDIRRLNAVDRNVIRTALYEMLYRNDIPPVVSINEAVDISKRFSSNESGRFVNGILDRARKDIKRPARKPLPPPQKKE